MRARRVRPAAATSMVGVGHKNGDGRERGFRPVAAISGGSHVMWEIFVVRTTKENIFFVCSVSVVNLVLVSCSTLKNLPMATGETFGSCSVYLLTGHTNGETAAN